MFSPGSGRTVRSSGRGSWIAACADLALVKAIRQNSMQMAGQLQGMASAGSVKGARGILAQGMHNWKRGERLSGWVSI